MLTERLGENDHPFRYLKGPGLSYEDRVGNREEQLEVIGLAVESSADDVRRVAISMRAQMREKGLNAQSVKALEYALEKTKDCEDERQFLWFLLDGYSFEDIEGSRSR